MNNTLFDEGLEKGWIVRKGDDGDPFITLQIDSKQFGGQIPEPDARHMDHMAQQRWGRKPVKTLVV